MISRLLLMSFLLCVSAPAEMRRFDVRDALYRNLVMFVSDALLEKTVGISNALSGWVELNPDDLSAGMKGEFEVDLRSFETGIEARNDYFKERILNVAEHPYGNFVIEKLISHSKPKLVNQQPTILKVEGTLKARGMAKAIKVTFKTTYFKESEITKQRLNGNLIRLSSDFDLDLGLFGVPLPEMVTSRVPKTVGITIDAVATDALPPTAIPLAPDVPKLKEKK